MQCTGLYKNMLVVCFGLEVLTVQWCNDGQSCLHSRTTLVVFLCECGILAGALGISACSTVHIVGVWDNIWWDHLPSALSRMRKAPKCMLFAGGILPMNIDKESI